MGDVRYRGLPSPACAHETHAVASGRRVRQVFQGEFPGVDEKLKFRNPEKLGVGQDFRLSISRCIQLPRLQSGWMGSL